MVGIDTFENKEQKFLKRFFKSRRKYLSFGLALILIFLIILYLVPFGGLERFGFIAQKKGQEQPSLAQTSTPSIDISTEARQTYYQSGVPHTDKSGNLITAYDSAKSFFPIGIFWVSSHSTDIGAISALKTAGFNTAVTAKEDNFYDTDPAFLLNQIGTDDSFKLIINQDLLTNASTNKRSDPTSFNESRFQTYKNDSRVLGWWMDDEPLNIATVLKDNPQFNYDANNQVYQAHKNQTSQVFFITDSGAPTQISNQPWFNSFMNLGSVASDYVYPKSVWETFNSFKLTADAVKAMVNAVGEKKPAWFVPQAFDGTGAIYPTSQEERAQVYTTIIHGATGILHFTWDNCIFRSWGAATGQSTDFSGIRPNIPQTLSNCPNSTVIDSSRQASASTLWNSLDASQNGINSELATLKPVILSPTSGENYSVFVDRTPISSAPIRTMLKFYNGEYYLLAVNIDNATINAKFQFSFQPLNSTVLFEGSRQPTIQGNSIIDSFVPFAVHVYKFKPGIIPVVSITTPFKGSRLMGKVNIKAEVSNLTPSKVEIKIDNILKATLNSAPYSYSWDTSLYSDAVHHIEIIAYDSSGSSFSSGIEFFQTINNCPDFNNDRIINVGDQLLLSKAAVSGVLYNPLYDLNGDGSINVGDTLLFAKWLQSKGGSPYSCPVPTPTPTPTPTPKSPPCYFTDSNGNQRGYGDVNADGWVDNTDLGLVMNSNLTVDQKKAADVDGNGTRNSTDLLKMSQYIQNQIVTFPVCLVPTPTPTPTPIPSKITATISGNSVLFRWVAQPNQGIIAVWPSSSPNACVNVNADLVHNSGALVANTSTYTWNGAPNGAYRAAFVQYVAGNTMPDGCTTSFAVGSVQGVSTIESQNFASMILTVITNFFERIF